MQTWYARFQTPTNAYRPKLRYWIPHGVICEKGIQKDVADIASRGFGSIEVVSMTRGLPDGFFTPERMWGSPQWLDNMNILLREAKKHGLKVDISNGPIWPIVSMTATCADDPSTLYELAYGIRILKAGEGYQGVVPPPVTTHEEGTARLLAVSMYAQTGELEIDFASYRALSVTDGVLSVPAANHARVIFSFWGRPACHQHSGRYVMDHFSAAGAKSMTDFWEQTLFPALSEHFDVLESMFCDSLEYRVDLEWTRTFLEDFKARKGYDLTPYLPVLGNEKVFLKQDGTLSSRNEGTYPVTNVSCYNFSDRTLQHKVNMDYFETITHLYCTQHVKPLQDVAAKYGLSVRYQVAYCKTLETEKSALYPGIPENEGLGNSVLDCYRDMAGAVHMAGKPVYSFECAAEAFHSYGQTHEDVLWWMKRAYIGGINYQVLHGGHYCGYYDKEGNENGFLPGMDWPGYEGFTRRTWSNAWNRTLSKETQYAVLTYLARCNFLLQGNTKIDLAVYQNRYLRSVPYFEGDGSFLVKDNNLLNDCGYSYEFLSPALLSHPNANITDRVLYKNGPAYKAILIQNEEYLSYDAAKRLSDFAKDGFPIFFIGNVPDKVAYQSENKTDGELQSLLASINYTFVQDFDALIPALLSKGIFPAMQPKTRVPLRAVHINRQAGDFYYLYNGSVRQKSDPKTMYPTLDKDNVMQEVQTTVSLQGTGDVYEIDGFSGAVTRLPGKSQNGRTSVSLHFARDEAKILAVLTKAQAEQLGIPSRIQELYAFKETPLTNWTFRLRRILPPKDKKGTFYESVWKDCDAISLQALAPWCELGEAFYKASGIGTYATHFSINAPVKKAVLWVAHVCDTYSVTVNGNTMPYCDPVLNETDITDALQPGENELKITVYSPLQNAASLDFLMREGKKDAPQKCGMWGDVLLKLAY